jgi:outer membrane protein, heavy metal efflux system
VGPVQAGLLRNPSLGADLGFRVSNAQTSEVRLSLVQDLLDLFVLPYRKQIAREQFEADALRVAHRALETAADVEKSVVAVQAHVEVVAYRETVVEAAAVAAQLAELQFEAGNVSELRRASERAAHEQAKLDLARERTELLEARERINRLLGLWGETTAWRLAEKLPPLPPLEPTVDDRGVRHAAAPRDGNLRRCGRHGDRDRDEYAAARPGHGTWVAEADGTFRMTASSSDVVVTLLDGQALVIPS